MDNGYKCIFAIVNDGFSETAMEAAKEAGARGGTILGARGSVSKEAEKFFNISIQPEKEMVMILVKNDIADAVLKNLYKTIGSSTNAQGIAFALPVDDVVGIEEKIANKKEDK